MAKTRLKSNGKTSVLVSVLLLAALMLLSAVAAAVSTSQRTYELAVGLIAPETVRAVEDVEDTVATEKLRELARRSVTPIYMIDAARAAELSAMATAFFDSLDKAVLTATEKKLLASVTDEFPTEERWRTILSSADIAALCSSVEPDITEDELFAVLQSSNSQLSFMRDTVLERLSSLLSNGLAESGLESVRNAFATELTSSLIAANLRPLAARVAVTFLEPTYVLDDAAMLIAQTAAAAETKPVIVEHGEVIVAQGDVVTEAQYAMMFQSGMIKTKTASALVYVGLALILLIIYGLLFIWMLSSGQAIGSVKGILIIAVFTLVSTGLNILCISVNPAFSASMIAVMLVCLLVGERPARAVAFVAAAVSAVMAAGHTGVMDFDSVVAAATVLAAGLTACFVLRTASKRSTMITAGLISGVAAAVTAAGIYLLAGKSALELIICAGWALGGHVLAAVLCAGTLSVWELLFDVATPARLSELTNANHPLLRQLMSDAPGTYHHSVMAAALAEAAAESVGANALLARVGAYYHDVGKLRRPMYFSENQKGENIHDTLRPEESASIIIAHQRDGAALLAKYKLPAEVVRIAAEHHGNSLVSYFYYKACEAAGDKNLDQTPYRYPGQRPATREGAIVMMSDCCEAAVRSLGDTTMERVEAMVHKLIGDMVSSGQLALAPLTLAELRTIEKTFLKTFVSLSHDRIEYPDFDGKGDADA